MSDFHIRPIIACLYMEVRHQNKIGLQMLISFCLEHFYTIRYNTFFHTFLCSTTYQKLVFYAGIPLISHRTDTNFPRNPYLVLEHLRFSRRPYLVLEHIQFSRRTLCLEHTGIFQEGTSYRTDISLIGLGVAAFRE